MNLFSNAIRYQDFHKESSQVSIHINSTVEKVEIRFSDNGIGIEKKHLKKIFDMFYRASDNSKGSGLGLYILKESIDKLGGSIKVETEFGVFTTFEITIPNIHPEIDDLK
jgi:signal transduction histidine kinase